MSSRRPLRALGFALGCVPAMLVAQSTTTAALSGTVHNAANKPLAGATVRISSPSMIGGEKSMGTNTNGGYRFPMLPPGRYKIVVESQGCSTQTGHEVLELGRTSSVNWKLQPVAVTVVEVVAETGSAESASTGTNQNFTAETIAALPGTRTMSSLLDMTPGVQNGMAWGSNCYGNCFMIEGVNTNDPSNGGQQLTPNMDWFEEVAVGGLGAPAEFGGFTGAMVNGILKRGGNEFSGTFNSYFTDSKWSAKRSNRKLQGLDREIAPSKNWDVGLSVGGPILKDKLWYFVSAEKIRNEYAYIGEDKPTVAKLNKFLGKITWQVTPNATLDGFVEYDDNKRDNIGLDRKTPEIATCRINEPNRTGGLTWTQIISSDKVLTIKALGYSSGYTTYPHGGDLPNLTLLTPAPGTIQTSFQNYSAVSDTVRSRGTVSAVFDWFLSSGMGTHALRMGAEREQATYKDITRPTGGLNYYGDVFSVDTGSVDANGNPITEDRLLPDTFTVGNWSHTQVRQDRFAAYLQDTWTVNDRLTVMPGLRFERSTAHSFGQSNVWDTSNWAPRLSVDYALTADQKHMLKAHWGRYYEGLQAHFFTKCIADANPVQTEYYWGYTNPDDYGVRPVLNPNDPSSWPAAIMDAAHIKSQTPSLPTLIDPNIKMPHSDVATLSYEWKLTKLWDASLTWINKQYKDTIVTHNLTPDPGTWVELDNPVTGGKISVWNTALTANQAVYIRTQDSRTKRNYNSYTLAVGRAFANRWSLNASYTHAKLIGNVNYVDGDTSMFYNPNRFVNATGLLRDCNDNEAKLRGTYEAPWGTRIGFSYTYLSGEHWENTMRSDKKYGPAGDTSRITVIAEPLGSQTYPSSHELEARVSQAFPFGKKVSLEVFGEVFNVFNIGAARGWSSTQKYMNSDYATDKNYRMPYDSNQYMYPEYTVDPRKVQFGARLKF